MEIQTMQIQPTAGFVIKCQKMTKILDNAEGWHLYIGKFFINLCHHEKIKAPNTINEEIIHKSILHQDSFKIPMSLSGLRKGYDKQNLECWAVDVCVNTMVFEWCAVQKFTLFTNLEFKQLLTDIALAFIQDRLQLNLTFQSFPKRLVMCPPLSEHTVKLAKQFMELLDCPINVFDYYKANRRVHQFHPVGMNCVVEQCKDKMRVKVEGQIYNFKISKKPIKCRYYKSAMVLRIYQ
eukprot:NODE_133_length_18153_cov_0.298050.p8 type:complete len:236 gc:universal NODE_133_length_18153_cov_0.298050:4520-3813(-)